MFPYTAWRMRVPGTKETGSTSRWCAATLPLTQCIAEELTAERVAEVFASRRPSAVKRYELPKLFAFNFVLDDVLEGGVNSSLGLDGHGKTLSFLLLAMSIRVNSALLSDTTMDPVRPAAE